MYQDLYEKTKIIFRRDTSIRFYDEAMSIYLQTDTSGIGLGARLLWVRYGMNCGHYQMPDNAVLQPNAFASKSLLSVECHYSDKEWMALVILHGLEKLHYYCLTGEVCILTNHEPLLAKLSKDVAMLSQWLKCIIPSIHQYRVHII